MGGRICVQRGLKGVRSWRRAAGCCVFFSVMVSECGSATFMLVGIGVFRLVCCWWMRGFVLRTLGYVGLPDDIMPVYTL